MATRTLRIVRFGPERVELAETAESEPDPFCLPGPFSLPEPCHLPGSHPSRASRGGTTRALLTSPRRIGTLAL